MTLAQAQSRGQVGRGRATRLITRAVRALTSPLVLAPVILAVVVVGAWQIGVFHTVFNIKSFTLPYPNSIAAAASTNGQQILDAIGVTLPAAVFGYALGMVLGLGVASLLVRFAPRLVNNLLPVLTATNAVPIVALVPVFALWLDDMGLLKILIVAFMTTPTMVIYAVRGLTNVEPAALELMASIEASDDQIYAFLRVPTSLPFLFTAMKSSVVLALIGTIVAETIRGFEGLGFVIADSLSSFNAPKAWLALLVIAAIGIGWYLIVEVLERVALPWESASRKRT